MGKIQSVIKGKLNLEKKFYCCFLKINFPSKMLFKLKKGEDGE